MKARRRAKVVARRSEIAEDGAVATKRAKEGASVRSATRKPRSPIAKPPTSPKAPRFASPEAFWSEVRRVACEELQRDFPNLTSATLDRWAKEYGPASDEPKAHEHLRAIRAAIDAAREHLGKLHLVPDALEGPDRQLLDVLRTLNLFPFTSALDHAERAVGFRAHDVPKLRDRRSLVEQMLTNRGVRFTARHFALTSIAVGFRPDVRWKDETVSSAVVAETRVVRVLLERLKESGSNGMKADIERVLSVRGARANRE